MLTEGTGAWNEAGRRVRATWCLRQGKELRCFLSRIGSHLKISAGERHELVWFGFLKILLDPSRGMTSQGWDGGAEWQQGARLDSRYGNLGGT